MSRRSRGLGWAEILVVGAAALLLLSGLASTDLWAPDEPRYAQIAEEVRASEFGAESWILLRLNGAPYSQKPPLYYWLAAAFGAPGSRVTEVAARLPSALAGIALVWVTFRLGCHLFGATRPALWGAALLLATYRFGHLARRAQLDVLLALFEALALLAFWRFDRGIGSARWNLVGLHAALGAAVMTKGPVGLLPLAVMAAALAWERRLGDFRRLVPAWGLLLSLGPGLVWIGGALALAPAGFFGDAIVDNVVGRFFVGTSHARPFYYFLYQFPLDCLPITLLWPLAWVSWRRAQRRGETETLRSQRFLWSWIAVFLVFFSLSAGKRGLYLLPAVPAVALLCGSALPAALESMSLRVRARLRAAGLAVAAALFVVGATVWIAPAIEVSPGFSLPWTAGAALTAAAGAALVATWRRLPGAVVAVCTVLAIEWAAFVWVYPAFDAQKSSRPIALAASALASPGEAVAVFDHPSGIGGIAYYGSQPVIGVPDEEALHRYWQGGGRIVIARGRRLARVESVAPVVIRARFRAGRRATYVLTPTSVPAEPPPARTSKSREDPT